jgi:hypothetical protein
LCQNGNSLTLPLSVSWTNLSCLGREHSVRQVDLRTYLMDCWVISKVWRTTRLNVSFILCSAAWPAIHVPSPLIPTFPVRNNPLWEFISGIVFRVHCTSGKFCLTNTDRLEMEFLWWKIESHWRVDEIQSFNRCWCCIVNGDAALPEYLEEQCTHAALVDELREWNRASGCWIQNANKQARTTDTGLWDQNKMCSPWKVPFGWTAPVKPAGSDTQMQDRIIISVRSAVKHKRPDKNKWMIWKFFW